METRWERLRGAPKRNPAGDFSDSWDGRMYRGTDPPWGWPSGPTSAYLSAWKDNRYEQVRHLKGWVYVAVLRIANAIAKSMPNVSILREEGDEDGAEGEKGGRVLRPREKRLILPREVRNKALVPLQQHEELEPAPGDHPLRRLLLNPNPDDTAFDLWMETTIYLEVTGSAYWWCPRNRAGLPLAAYCVPSQWVWPVPDERGGIKGYMLRPVEGYATAVTLPAEDVVVFRKRSPLSKWDGYAPTTAGSLWIDCEEAVDRSRWHGVRNSYSPGMILEFDGTTGTPDKPTLDRLRAKLDEYYGGETKAGRAFITPYGMKAKPLGFSVNEMAFEKTFDQLADSVLAVFGVPGAVAGRIKSMTFGSVLAAQADFYAGTVNPLFSFYGQTLTEKLACRYDDKLRVWWPDQTPEDPAAREQELRTDMTGGVRTVNEHRRVRGLKPFPGEEGNQRCFAGANQIDTKDNERRNDGYEGDDGQMRPDQANGKDEDKHLTPNFSRNGYHGAN